MSNFRRGFKKEVNEIAREIRRELGLHPADPLDPWKLADYLAIPVLTLKQFAKEAPKAFELFRGLEEDAFSAVTVFHGSARVIVHNNFHARVRQASDLAHEISHALLLHPPMQAFDALGCRNWNDEFESEANWLAGALLISEEAALRIVRDDLDPQYASAKYGVSQKMLQFRLNVTGAHKRVDRERRRYRRG